jgi:hypothetical protein
MESRLCPKHGFDVKRELDCQGAVEGRKLAGGEPTTAFGDPVPGDGSDLIGDRT